MHEWALAEGVIKAAVEKARENGITSIDAIELKIGEMQDIDMEIFKFALSQLMKEFGIKASVDINIERTKFKCMVCGYEWYFEEFEMDENEKEMVHFLPESIFSHAKCPKCGSQYFEIVEGRGVWITSIKGER